MTMEIDLFRGIFLFVQVIAESLSEEEIGGLKELFKMIDTDNSGTITYDELKNGLKRVGSDLMEPEIQALMDAVSTTIASRLLSKENGCSVASFDCRYH
jgi:Ca2+-binding EF-hand superfamily protein